MGRSVAQVLARLGGPSTNKRMKNTTNKRMVEIFRLVDKILACYMLRSTFVDYHYNRLYSFIRSFFHSFIR